MDDMEKKKLLHWFWALVFGANVVCADEFESFKKDIFGKAQVEAKRFASAASILKKSVKPADTKMIDSIMLRAKKESLRLKDTVERTKRKAKKEAVKWKDTVSEAKANAKKFAKSWKFKKDDTMREAFTGYADLPTTKGVGSSNTGMYIFVSFGMPKNLLLDLEAQASKIGARLVVRGLKGDSFKETIHYIQELNKEGIKVDINPKLFENFKIKHVPSFVVTNKQNSSYDKMTGNVTMG